ncbi:hypothetical protein LEP1GSC109_0105, partial [Leptospira interrogans str. UI 13372]
KDKNYDLVFNLNMINFERIIEANNKLIKKFNENKNQYKIANDV